MTRPTDTEIAALLRELAQSIDELVYDVGLPEEKNGKLADRARAMAERLEGEG